MNKIIKSTFISMVAASLLVTPAFAESKSTWYCYTNSYGQQTCSENKEATEKYERVVVRQLAPEEAKVINETAKVNQEGAVVQEHKPLDTALTTDQLITLMSLMVIALGAVVYKFKKAN